MLMRMSVIRGGSSGRTQPSTCSTSLHPGLQPPTKSGSSSELPKRGMAHPESDANGPQCTMCVYVTRPDVSVAACVGLVSCRAHAARFVPCQRPQSAQVSWLDFGRRDKCTLATVSHVPKKGQHCVKLRQLSAVYPKRLTLRQAQAAGIPKPRGGCPDWSLSQALAGSLPAVSFSRMGERLKCCVGTYQKSSMNRSAVCRTLDINSLLAASSTPAPI